jgi:hypothetical protein
MALWVMREHGAVKPKQAVFSTPEVQWQILCRAMPDDEIVIEI